MKILITGGCGFVGSNLAKYFAKDGDSVFIIDNLKRRGSESNIYDFKKLNIKFIHGDLRIKDDIHCIEEDFDLIIDAAAEPSVLSGINNDNIRYVLDTNLYGTINILDFAIKRSKCMVFLSTSRVYSIKDLKNIPLIENDSRFNIDINQKLPIGLSKFGINENFPTNSSFRSVYGTTKLASELITQEYSYLFNYPIIINRCGIISGAGQFGKNDQGIFSFILSKYLLKENIKFFGFNGEGKQVRDILHPLDLYYLIRKQYELHPSWKADIYSVGGGILNSVSLKDYSIICEKLTGNKVNISKIKDTTDVDIPYYVTDYSLVSKKFNWIPNIDKYQIFEDIYNWLNNNYNLLHNILKE
jgi:CDP-paratose 2-epimerase